MYRAKTRYTADTLKHTRGDQLTTYLRSHCRRPYILNPRRHPAPPTPGRGPVEEAW